MTEELTESQRDVLRRRISRLEGAIVDRNAEIRIIEENIGILEAERDRIDNTLLNFSESYLAGYVSNLDTTHVRAFNGVSRTKLEDILTEMRDEISSRKNDHRENMDIIRQKVTKLEADVTSLNSENVRDSVRVTNLRWELATGGQPQPNF